jgi:hypothetical protein
MEGLWLSGPGKANSGAYGFSGPLTYGWIRSCRFDGYWYGVNIVGGAGARIERNRFTQNHAGINAAATNPAFLNLLHFAGNYLDFNDFGVYVSEAYGVVLDTNAVEYNATGMYLNNARQIDMRGNNWFEAQTGYAFQIVGSSTGTLAQSTHVVTAAGNGYTIDTANARVVDLLTPSIALLTLSTTFSIPHNSATDVAWDMETADPANLHPAGAATTVTVANPGIYEIAAVVQFASFATPGAGVFGQITVTRNGAPLRAVSHLMVANQPTQVALSFLEELAAGDLIRVSAYQNTGGALNVLAGPVSSFALSYRAPN